MINPVKKKCLTCGYERQPEDESEFTHASECPKCHAIYEKVERLLLKKEYVKAEEWLNKKERGRPLLKTGQQSPEENILDPKSSIEDSQKSKVSKPVNVKIYKIAILALAVIVIGFAYLYRGNHTITQAGKDAYKALKKIEAQTSSGVNFQNYSASVSNATLEYEMYQAGKERKNKNFLNFLGKALTAYQYSKDIWHKQIDIRNKDDDTYEENLLSKMELDTYAKLFPVLYKEEKLTTKDFMKICDDSNYANLLRIIARSALWVEASKELINARQLIDE